MFQPFWDHIWWCIAWNVLGCIMQNILGAHCHILGCFSTLRACFHILGHIAIKTTCHSQCTGWLLIFVFIPPQHLGINLKSKTINLEATQHHNITRQWHFAQSMHVIVSQGKSTACPTKKMQTLRIGPKQQKCIATRPNVHLGGNARLLALIGKQDHCNLWQPIGSRKKGKNKINNQPLSSTKSFLGKVCYNVVWYPFF